jgi:hypothetical protein
VYYSLCLDKELSVTELEFLNDTISGVLYNQAFQDMFNSDFPFIERLGYNVSLTEVLTESGKCFVYNALPVDDLMDTNR